MYITINNARHPCTWYAPMSDTVTFSGVEGLELPVVGTVTLWADDGFELATQVAEDYARQTLVGDVLTLTNLPEPEPVVPDLNTVKAARISESKTALSDYLAAHPLTWTNGKQYSVTEDKQALLTGNIAAYQLAVALGQTTELTWNATGEECTVWAFNDLAALSLAIKAYVKPFVSYQQSKEVAINACTTAEEAEAVVVDYSTVTAGGLKL